MGSTNNFRLPYTIYQTALANSAKNNSGKDIASAEITARCDNRTNQQTSYKDGNRPSDQSVHFNPICSSTDQQNTPSVQPVTAEQFCGNTQVQNGGLSFATLNPAGNRLYDEVGLEGRLFFHPNSRGAQEVSSVHFQRPPIRISVPTIWVVNSTKDIYEGPETCDCFVETTRATSDYIPRRSAVAFRSQGTREIISRNVSTADRSRVSYQGEMLDSSSAIPCFSWCSDQLIDHDLGSTSYKVTRVTVRSTGLEKEENMCNKGTVGPSRANDSNFQDRGGICTPSLQELTKTAHQVDSQVRNISSETTDYTHAGSHGRLGMVDINETTGGEFSTDNGTDPQHHNPNRRIPAWLGEKTGSHWSTKEQEAHINVLELKAAHLAIQSYLKKDLCQLPGKRLLLQMDNTTAVAYINKWGGTKSN